MPIVYSMAGAAYLVLGLLCLNVFLSSEMTFFEVTGSALFLGGFFHFGIAFALKRTRIEKSIPKLTEPAKRLLTTLDRKFKSDRPFWNLALSFKPRPCTVLDELGNALEECSSEYNRIVGTLALSSHSYSLVGRYQERIIRAADEAMLDVMHQTSIASSFPETLFSVKETLALRLNSLTELARFVDQTSASELPVLTSISGQDLMDEVLQELRLDLRSRYEI